jgi:hypothetical protein
MTQKNVEIKNCFLFFVSASSLDLEINLNGPDTNNQIPYGSDGVYDVSILTIPRSSIIVDISRNGISLANDKRFELLSM